MGHDQQPSRLLRTHASTTAFLPAAAAAALHASGTSAIGVHPGKPAEAGIPGFAQRLPDVLATAAALMWEAALPTVARCEAAAADCNGSAAAASAANGSGNTHEGHHFHEEAPPLPSGSLRGFRSSGRLAAALASYSPFAGGYTHAGHGDYAGHSVNTIQHDGGGNGGSGRSGSGNGGSSNGGAGGGIVRGIVNRGRQRMQGGLLLMATGLAGVVARELWHHGLEWAKRRLLVRCELDNRDDAYRWVMAWLAHHPDFAASNAFTVSSSLAAFGATPIAMPAGAGQPSRPGAAGPELMCLPAAGLHALRFRGRRVWIRRERESGPTDFKPLEHLEITVLALQGGRAVVAALLAEAHANYERMQSERTAIFAADQDAYYWEQVGSRPIRPLASVVLPTAQAESVLADCRRFERSEEWYAQHGIPYRRGYLLHGLPGTGKTSLVTALAGALRRPIYVISLSSKGMGDEALRSLLNSAAPRCMLLLEDVDAAFLERKADDAKGLTFSGLLNAIDGVAAQEGRLLFMTTNHVERLAPALVRPGRVDVRLAFAHATAQQTRNFFVSFYQDVSLGDALGVASASPDTADFAAKVAAQERQLAANSATAIAAAAADLPAELAQDAISLAAPDIVEPLAATAVPGSRHPAAAQSSAAPARTAAAPEASAREHTATGQADSLAAASAAASGPPADGVTAAAAPALPSPAGGADAAAAPAPLGQQASGGVEITDVQPVRGAADSAAAADLVSKAATVVAAFHVQRLTPAAQGPDAFSAAEGAGAATGLQRCDLSRSISIGSSREAAGAAAKNAALADVANAVRDAVVVALAGVFVERVPGGTASIARLQGHLMTFRQEPAAAVAQCAVLLEGSSDDAGGEGDSGKAEVGSAADS